MSMSRPSDGDASPAAFTHPEPGLTEDAAVPYLPGDAAGPHGSPPSERRRLEDRLLAEDGVLGVSEGQTAAGDPALIVYVRDDAVKRRLGTLPEYAVLPLVITITGPIVAQ
jgi:hypothetical protein